MTRRHLTCCCCGAAAGFFLQHWNRDTGFGICASCAAEEAGTSTPEELVSRYGQPGINYERPTVVHMGKQFKVLATFSNTDAGTRAANAFMARTPGAAVLLVTSRVVLADETDLGSAVPSDAR